MGPACYVYVDGAYVRSHLVAAGHSAEFTPTIPADLVRGLMLGPNQMWGLIVRRIFYYDAVDESRPEEAERQERYFARLRRLPDVHVVLGDVRRRVKGPREQKGVDVQLAVDALEVASSGRVDAIALVTGDADFVPLAGAIRRAGPHVIVMAFPSSLSDRLEAEADRSIFLPEPPPDSWDLWQFERDMGFEE